MVPSPTRFSDFRPVTGTVVQETASRRADDRTVASGFIVTNTTNPIAARQARAGRAVSAEARSSRRAVASAATPYAMCATAPLAWTFQENARGPGVHRI